MIKLILGSILLYLFYLILVPIPPVIQVENDYQQYITTFERESVIHNHPIKVTNLIIKTVPTLGEFIIAQCRRNVTRTPEILVSEVQWKNYNEDEHEFVILHEISHCVLNRGHSSFKDKDGLPLSIMEPVIFPIQLYLSRRYQYMEELFTNSF